MKRRMAALMVGDIVGYSGMMERSEEQTAERLANWQALISEKVGLYTDWNHWIIGNTDFFAEHPFGKRAELQLCEYFPQCLFIPFFLF